jgi:hypothetical protein
MKQCSVEGCTNPVFGKGYCKYHQYHRTDLKVKTYIKNIKVVSSKRLSQLIIYSAAKIIAWDNALKTGNNRCFICNRQFNTKTIPDWHHLDGREEDLLLDQQFLRFAHRQCHEEIHNLYYDLLKLKPWYEGYLQRLKEIDQKLYDKEYDKRFKAIRKDTTI